MKAIKERGKMEVPVIEVDKQQLRAYVSEVVRESVEQTLNGLLEAEADVLCQARRYERNAQRAGTRAGHYERSFQTRAGTVQIKMPKLRQVAFETAIIERYRRRESSVEEALVEMYLAGVSVRRRISPRRCGEAGSAQVKTISAQAR
jgi:transposase-like protein